MKKIIIFLTALALAILTGCASHTGATLNGKPIAEVRDNGDSPEKIDAKGKFLGRATAATNAADTSMDDGLRTVNAGIASDVDLRGLGTAIREATRATKRNADPTTTAATAASKSFTKDGAYWRWSDKPWWYFKEDPNGEHKLSRDNVRDYLASPDEKQRALKIWGLID